MKTTPSHRRHHHRHVRGDDLDHPHTPMTMPPPIQPQTLPRRGVRAPRHSSVPPMYHKVLRKPSPCLRQDFHADLFSTPSRRQGVMMMAEPMFSASASAMLECLSPCSSAKERNDRVQIRLNFDNL